MPLSCKEVVPDAGRELRELTSTLLRHHLVLQGDWRKRLLPLRAGCKAMLGIGPRSSWRRRASGGACIKVSDMQSINERECSTSSSQFENLMSSFWKKLM